MSASTYAEAVPAPRGWLRLALFGAFVYLASKLMAFYPDAASRATGLSSTVLATYLPVAAGAGLVFVLCGLVAAFWRVNRATGHTHAGVAGLVAGALGVVVLAGLVLLDLAGAMGLQATLLTAIANAEPVADPFGTFLAFVGLATLGLGVAHAGSVFESPASPRRVPQRAPDAQSY